MSGIASKNLFELLGNDPELDPDREPEPPTKAIDKPVARAGKRNAPAEAPVRDAGRGGRGGHRDGFGGNEGAFRDRGAGSNQNRSRPAGDANDSGYRGGRGRGGRGRGRGAPTPGDRHSRTGIAEHEKQTAHGWGGQTGGEEWADEKAGETIAKDEEKAEGFVPEGDEAVPAGEEGFKPEATGEDAEAEPEDKTKSYAAYLAEQAERKLNLGAPEARRPNEGGSKKFPEGKAITREEEEDAYIAGTGGKPKRERQRKEKTLVELDDSRLHKEPRDSFRGGRGGRGRGEGGFRGDRGERRGRGGRGDRGGEHRGGEYRGRGGRSGVSITPNVSDQTAFPSLGA